MVIKFLWRASGCNYWLVLLSFFRLTRQLWQICSSPPVFPVFCSPLGDKPQTLTVLELLFSCWGCRACATFCRIISTDFVRSDQFLHTRYLLVIIGSPTMQRKRLSVCRTKTFNVVSEITGVKIIRSCSHHQLKHRLLSDFKLHRPFS